MKKLLSLLGSVGLMGTAGATVVACGSKAKPKEPPKENPIEVGKEKLKNLIEEARGLVNTSKKEAEVTDGLRSAITDAEAVLAKEDLTEAGLNSALADLQKAIDYFKNAMDADVIAARKTLGDKILEAQQLVDTSKKEEPVTEALKSAITEAQSVLDTNLYAANLEQLQEAITKLEKAIETFKAAKDAIVIAREALQAKINEAQEMVTNSKKEESVTEALEAAIEKAKTVLNDQNANINSVKEATVELTKAIGEFNQVKDLDQELQDKINQIKQNKADSESLNLKNGWDSIAEKNQKDFDSSIKEAEELVKKVCLTRAEVNKQSDKLDEALAKFKASLPQTIISEIINAKKEEIKGLIPGSWAYSSFFDVRGKDDGNARLMDVLAEEVANVAKQKEYSEAEQNKLSQLVIEYFQNDVKLVYLNEQDGQQKIKTIISQVNPSTTLKQIFLDNVRKEFPNEDVNDPNFWKAHPNLSLGVLFETKKLDAGTKEFWAFNFAKETITADDYADVQKLFREAEAREGGWIVLNGPKGLSPFDGTLIGYLNKEFHKKVFYGRYFLPQFSASWTQNVNSKQAKEGIIGWKSGKDAHLIVNIPFTVKQLFRVSTNYIINII